MTVLLLTLVFAADFPGPGISHREIEFAGATRTYVVYAPPSYDPEQVIPVVLVMHGALGNGDLMMSFTRLNETADEKGFLAVYPDGTGYGPFLRWNAGFVAEPPDEPPDDVAFVSAVIDDLAANYRIDADRVFATGISNGAMMCYRLAAELSDRIAAIAPVAGTMTQPDPRPTHRVSVIHFHGTDDFLVPLGGPTAFILQLLTFLSVDDTLRTWSELNGCDFLHPLITQLPDLVDDGMTVRELVFGPGPNGEEVVLISIDGGGHTWPGRWTWLSLLLGRVARDISANDVMWDFFERHPRVPSSGTINTAKSS